MNRRRIAAVAIMIAAFSFAACSDTRSDVDTGGTTPQAVQPFRVFEAERWHEPIIVGSQAVLVGKYVDGGSELQVRTVEPSGDRTEPVLGGMLLARVSATGKDGSSVIIELRPCEAVGPSGGSIEGNTCTKRGGSRLIEYNLDDRTTDDVAVPNELQTLLDGSHLVDLDAYSDGTLFATLHDGYDIAEVRWDMVSDGFLSSPIDGNSSVDNVFTCVADDGVRYDTVTKAGTLTVNFDQVEPGPSHVERRDSTGERTVEGLPEPPGSLARWQPVCVGGSAFVVADGTEIKNDPDPQPTSILRLPDLTQVPAVTDGRLSWDAVGGVLSDGDTVELIEEDGSLSTIPWIPPGNADTSGNVLVEVLSLGTMPENSVVIDLEKYDDSASKALKEQMWG